MTSHALVETGARGESHDVITTSVRVGRRVAIHIYTTTMGMRGVRCGAPGAGNGTRTAEGNMTGWDSVCSGGAFTGLCRRLTAEEAYAASLQRFWRLRTRTHSRDLVATTMMMTTTTDRVWSDKPARACTSTPLCVEAHSPGSAPELPRDPQVSFSLSQRLGWKEGEDWGWRKGGEATCEEGGDEDELALLRRASCAGAERTCACRAVATTLSLCLRKVVARASTTDCVEVAVRNLVRFPRHQHGAALRVQARGRGDMLTVTG